MTGTAVAMAHWQHRGAGTTRSAAISIYHAKSPTAQLAVHRLQVSQSQLRCTSEARPRTLGPSRRWQRAAQATAGMYCDSWALAQEVALNCKSRRLAAAFISSWAQVVRARAWRSGTASLRGWIRRIVGEKNLDDLTLWEFVMSRKFS